MIQEERETVERIKEAAGRQIWITFRKEGIHCYPAAATDPQLATGDEYDVSFLASPHRHIFHFRVWIDVFHNDRDIEFIQFKRWLENLYKDGVLQLDYKSCEMMPTTYMSKLLHVIPVVVLQLKCPRTVKTDVQFLIILPVQHIQL